MDYKKIMQEAIKSTNGGRKAPKNYKKFTEVPAQIRDMDDDRSYMSKMARAEIWGKNKSTISLDDVTFRSHYKNNNQDIYWLNVNNDVYGVSITNNGASKQVLNSEGFSIEDGYLNELFVIVERLID